MIAPKSRIVLNVRGLAELSFLAAGLSLALIAAWWSWQGPVTPMTPVWLVAARRPEIVAALALAGFILILAGLLSVVPPAWWLRVRQGAGVPVPRAETPTRWLGEQIQRALHPAPAAQPDPAIPEGDVPDPAGQGPAAVADVGPDGQATTGPVVAAQPLPAQAGTAPVANPGALPGQAAPAQPAPGQTVQAFDGQAANPGTAVPQVQAVVPGQPVAPGEPQPKPAASPPAEGQPAAAPPPAPLSSVLNFEENPEEEDPLAGLGDIKDILASAFDEDSAMDPDRLALGRSLDDVNIRALLRTANQVRAAFAGA